MYTSSSLSLAAIEYFVNLEAPEAPDDLIAIPADIPEGLSTAQVQLADLPANWRAYPAPDALANLGTDWVQESKTAVLIVPSAVIPRERNYLLNPVHREFNKIRIGPAEAFSFDPRMWKHPRYR